MIERIGIPQNSGVLKMPQPETGMCKTKQELAPFFHIPQGGISVNTFQDGVVAQTFIRIEPEMDSFTRAFINQRIAQRRSISEVKKHFEAFRFNLPSVHVLVDGDIQFWLEGELAGRIKKGRGFVANKKYSLGNEDLLGRSLVRPEDNQTDENKFTLTYFRKQEVPVVGGRQNMLIAPQFTFSTNNFKELNEQIKAWTQNPERKDEELRNLVNVRLALKARSFFGNEDNDTGGLVLAERDPDDSGDDHMTFSQK